MEIWKDLPAMPDAYEVSNQGRVRKKSDGMVLRTGPRARDGYCHVGLTVGYGKYKTVQLHRQVALAFLPTDDETMQVHHKNGDKSDNRVENLEWLSPREHAAKDAELRRMTGRTTKAKENAKARREFAGRKLEFEKTCPFLAP